MSTYADHSIINLCSSRVLLDLLDVFFAAATVLEIPADVWLCLDVGPGSSAFELSGAVCNLGFGVCSLRCLWPWAIYCFVLFIGLKALES